MRRRPRRRTRGSSIPPSWPAACGNSAASSVRRSASRTRRSWRSRCPTGPPSPTRRRAGRAGRAVQADHLVQRGPGLVRRPATARLGVEVHQHPHRPGHRLLQAVAAATSRRSTAEARRLGVGQGRLLHVAQSLFHDHVPAKQAGLPTVWINRRHGQPGWGATPLPRRESPRTGSSRRWWRSPTRSPQNRPHHDRPGDRVPGGGGPARAARRRVLRGRAHRQPVQRHAARGVRLRRPGARPQPRRRRADRAADRRDRAASGRDRPGPARRRRPHQPRGPGPPGLGRALGSRARTLGGERVRGRLRLPAGDGVPVGPDRAARRRRRGPRLPAAAAPRGRLLRRRHPPLPGGQGRRPGPDRGRHQPGHRADRGPPGPGHRRRRAGRRAPAR